MRIEIDQLKKLPVDQKLRIVEELWDDILASDEPLTLPPETQHEILNRAADLDTDPDSALTRQELWQQVNTPHG
jgi:putative addiction module component (TIGR02574 family)